MSRKKQKRQKEQENRKEREKIEVLAQKMAAPDFLMQKNWVVENVEFKLRMINLELSEEYKRTVMQKVEHRIKSAQSISRKLVKKGYDVTFQNAVDKLNDIVGVRAVCLYSDDVYKIAELLKSQADFVLLKEKDYIKNPKKSGYQSLHLIMEVPITYKETEKMHRVEIQIRTVAMDFWAGVDNQICYKKSPEEMKKAEGELRTYSNVISKMDKQMLELRKKVEKM